MQAAMAQYALILAVAFVNEGLPPEWGLAIARQESAFRPTALNMSSGDATRGGSWGLCQMSLLTARGLGYIGDNLGLLDPKVNAQLAAKLCKELSLRFKTMDLQDIASAYNSGKPYARAPASTKTVYVPRVLAGAEMYRDFARKLVAEIKP